MVRTVLTITLLLTASAAAARGSVIFAGGAWAAIDRGAQCEALTRSQRVATKDKVQAVAGFSFHGRRRRWGEFHARLSRMPRGDASVMLQIGDQPFLLARATAGRGAAGRMQAQAIIAAARERRDHARRSRDQRGVRFADPYLLDGAPTAIDAAAARCALRALAKSSDRT